jgi:hypothetical protein
MDEQLSCLCPSRERQTQLLNRWHSVPAKGGPLHAAVTSSSKILGGGRVPGRTAVSDFGWDAIVYRVAQRQIVSGSGRTG